MRTWREVRNFASQIFLLTLDLETSLERDFASLCLEDDQSCSQVYCLKTMWFNYRPAEAFRKNLQIWNLLKSMSGYICLTELLALDKVHFYKNNECYIFCVPFRFIYLFYDQIRGHSPPLAHRCGTWPDNLSVFSVPLRSLSWKVHLVQRTQWTYQQINLSIYPLNVAISKWPARQINCPSLQ